jgi:predicted flap endonuclease-1-like 5' DNA nuclease
VPPSPPAAASPTLASRVAVVASEAVAGAAVASLATAASVASGATAQPSKPETAGAADTPPALAQRIGDTGKAAEAPSLVPDEPLDQRPPRSDATHAALDPIGSRAGEMDDLKRIRGIGVLIEKKLNAMGVTRYEQIARWTSADIDRVSHVLDFRGRIERENWVEQARILASGGHTEFSRRADRGDFGGL